MSPRMSFAESGVAAHDAPANAEPARPAPMPMTAARRVIMKLLPPCAMYARPRWSDQPGCAVAFVELERFSI
jgi:hypothetical protein